MDVYRAINADVPQVLFTIILQARPTVLHEEIIRTGSALQTDFRNQVLEIGELLHQWLARQCNQQAEETVQKLQRLGILSVHADLTEVQQILERDFSRLGSRLGSVTTIGMQGSVVEICTDETPTDPDLAQYFVHGLEYVTSLGFKPVQGLLYEISLLFRGSIHYDMLEHIVRDRMSIYTGSYGYQTENIERTSFSTYNLIYQLGESLAADPGIEAATHEITLAFSKGPIPYSQIRKEVSALMEYIGESIHLIHASFWQRKLGLGIGKEFLLRLRLPIGEASLKDVMNEIANAEHVGKEAIVKRGKLTLGKRVF